MKSNYIIKLACFFLSVLIFFSNASCQKNKTNETKDNKEMSNKFRGNITAPDFPKSLEWLNTNKPLSLKDLKGKIVLLDFWTYCCINCIHILPDLKKLEHEFPELVVIGVHSAKFQNEKDAGNIRAAILRYEIEHPVIVDNEFIIWQEYGIRAWPSFVLIDPDGKVVGQTSGEGIYESIKPYIEGISNLFANENKINKIPLHFELEINKSDNSLLSFPGKIIADENNNRLLFSDSNHNRIIVCNEKGQILHIIGNSKIGNQDGTFEQASFFRPQGLAYDAKTDVLYVADTENHLVRKCDFKTLTVSTIAGTGIQNKGYKLNNNAKEQALNSPWDLTLFNNALYIAMAGSHQIWKMDFNTNKIEVYAGSGHENIVDGGRLEAALAQPSGITASPKGLFIADSEVSAIRYIDDTSVSTLIGEGLFEFGDIDGKYPKARLQHCLGVLFHQDKILISDTYNHKIKILDPISKTITTLAGNGKKGYKDGNLMEAQFNEPNDLAYLNGKFYIADANNNLIRILDIDNKNVSTLTFENIAKVSIMQLEKTHNQHSTTKFVQKITLEKQKVPAKLQKLSLTLELNNYYKANNEAPNFAECNGQIAKIETENNFITFTFNNISTENLHSIIIQLGYYYCEKGKEARCFIKQNTFEIPIEFYPLSKDEIILNFPVQD